jgi:hypothetical protein
MTRRVVARFVSKTRQLKQWLAHAIVAIICGVGIFFAHELGHALTALLLGGSVQVFNVLGIQWYPKLLWMPQLGLGGFVIWTNPYNPVVPNLIIAAGSTSTLLLALCAALLGNVTRARGVARTACLTLSLYFLDSVIHLIPVLGVTYYWATTRVRGFSEAYFAFADLGIPGPFYSAFVFIVTLVILLLDARALTRRARTPEPILPHAQVGKTV